MANKSDVKKRDRRWSVSDHVDDTEPAASTVNTVQVPFMRRTAIKMSVKNDPVIVLIARRSRSRKAKKSERKKNEYTDGFKFLRRSTRRTGSARRKHRTAKLCSYMYLFVKSR